MVVPLQATGVATHATTTMPPWDLLRDPLVATHSFVVKHVVTTTTLVRTAIQTTCRRSVHTPVSVILAQMEKAPVLAPVLAAQSRQILAAPVQGQILARPRVAA